MTDSKRVLTRRTIIKRLGLEREILDRLEEIQIIIPIRRPGRERAYCLEDVDRLRVYCVLVRELDVNPAGAEIILRMRSQLLGVRHRLTRFLNQACEEGILEQLREIVAALEDEQL